VLHIPPTNSPESVATVKNLMSVALTTHVISSETARVGLASISISKHRFGVRVGSKPDCAPQMMGGDITVEPRA
jgi:hypothetical protein